MLRNKEITCSVTMGLIRKQSALIVLKNTRKTSLKICFLRDSLQTVENAQKTNKDNINVK